MAALLGIRDVWGHRLRMLDIDAIDRTTIMIHRPAASSDGVQVREECAHFGTSTGPLSETVDGFTRYCILGGDRASPPLPLVVHRAQEGDLLPERMREAVRARLKARKSRLTVDSRGVLIGGL